MTAEVKVKLVWVGDVCVHCGASRNVSTSSHLIRRNNVKIYWLKIIWVYLLQKQVFFKYALTGVQLHLLILSFKDPKSISRVHMINLYIYNFIIIIISLSLSLSDYVVLLLPPHTSTSSLISWTEVRALITKNVHKHSYFFPVLSQLLIASRLNMQPSCLQTPYSDLTKHHQLVTHCTFNLKLQVVFPSSFPLTITGHCFQILTTLYKNSKFLIWLTN